MIGDVNQRGTTQMDADETPKATVIVLDRDHNPWGPFDGLTAAAEFAKRQWPDQEEDMLDRWVKKGWNVVVLRHPDSA
jgi:hypothetical protein